MSQSPQQKHQKAAARVWAVVFLALFALAVLSIVTNYGVLVIFAADVFSGAVGWVAAAVPSALAAIWALLARYDAQNDGGVIVKPNRYRRAIEANRYNLILDAALTLAYFLMIAGEQFTRVVVSPESAASATASQLLTFWVVFLDFARVVMPPAVILAFGVLFTWNPLAIVSYMRDDHDIEDDAPEIAGGRAPRSGAPVDLAPETPDDVPVSGGDAPEFNPKPVAP